MLECKHCGDMFEALQCHSFRRSYCSNECRESAPDYIKAKMMRLRGSRNPAWKGVRQRQSNGYVYLVRPEHPFADQTGRILEHRLVMEEWLRLNEPNSLFLTKLGSQKYLRPEFIVHHKDEVKSNNVIENLECMTKPQHALLHNAGAKEKAASA